MSAFMRRNPTAAPTGSFLPLSSNPARAGQPHGLTTTMYSPPYSLRQRLVVWTRIPLIRIIVVVSVTLYFIFGFRHSRENESSLLVISSPKQLNENHPSTSAMPEISSPQTQPEPRLEDHQFLANGLLAVNPHGRHPIYDLISHADKEWQRKLDSQSRTLDEAVANYRTRYTRPPPKGFDKWWKYVERHNVQLPDEYDQIMADLGMFYAHTPHDLRRLQELTRTHDGTFTFASSSITGTITINTTALTPNEKESALIRARNQLNLLHGYGETWRDEHGRMRTVEKEIVEATGDWEATFLSYDAPTDFGDWDLFEERRMMAQSGRAMDVFKKGDTGTYVGWGGACPHTSSLRMKYPDPPPLPIPEPEHKTFIWDHRAVMYPCDHPDLVHVHGHFLSHGKGPGPQQMHPLLFALCKTEGMHGDVLTASSEGWSEDIGTDPEWKEKTDERLVWRGSTTGIWNGPNQPWRFSHRIRLIAALNEPYGNHSVLSPTEINQPVGHPMSRDIAWLNHVFADAAFVRAPMQCDEAICPIMKQMFDFPRALSQEEQNQYKYVMDIDGNGWSSRFKRIITANSVILKATIFPEWYMDRIMPWVHYVPVKMDLTDLYDILTFFRGDVARGGEGGHDHLAEKIATAGKQWSKTFFRREDMIAYMWRLFLEYGRLVSDERDHLNFEP